ncbi:MAG: helix-turn-helix domain-containing protein [Candidatus Krumholzibacteriota bacterium]|nr:helix-turn-helix domain-containing protein [Candidatus Krumholzibacteriota bacterium]
MSDNEKTTGDNGEVDSRDPLSGEETVGEILFSAREKAGVTRAQISESTRIPEETLKYLETDNFDMLPARVYVRGFIRNFAGELGLDVEHLLERYEVQTGQTHKSKGDFWEVKEKTIEEKRTSAAIPKNLLMIVSVLAVVILIFVFVFRSDDRPDVLPQSTIPDVEEFIGKNMNKEGMNKKEINQSFRKDSVKISNPEKAKDTSSGKSVEKKTLPLELKIIANKTDTTWFDIISISRKDQKPDTAYYDFILLPGGEKELTATDAFIFRKIGNAAGFRIEFNGEKIAPLGETNEVLENIYLGRDSIALGNI